MGACVRACVRACVCVHACEKECVCVCVCICAVIDYLFIKLVKRVVLALYCLDLAQPAELPL